MNPMKEAWSLLKGSMKTVDLIAQESSTMEEAIQSMKESFPNVPTEQAIQVIAQAKNQQARDRASQPQVANMVSSSPQEMMNRNPNMKNFASRTGNLDDM